MMNLTCTFCVMDNSDPDIIFDEYGRCQHCISYLDNIGNLPAFSSDAELQLENLVSKMKADGKRSKYDCIIGLSGGVDSTYLAYVIKKKLGLRPLAVHMDNGWNSELSVKNVENIIKKLEIDYETKILYWQEFSSLQLAFLKASTPDSEIPTDHAICATLYQLAAKHNIKYVISGVNFLTERIMPPAWSRGHSDYRYIKNVNKLHGNKKLKSFPHITESKRWWYSKIKNIQFVPIFNYFKFDLTEAKTIIQNELNWQEYGGKHYESVYTKFFQGHILPAKFGFDKRKGHLSNLICAGEISREQALDILNQPPIADNELPNLKRYVAKKFNISMEDLEQILIAKPKTYWDYPNNYNTYWYRYSRKYLKPVYYFMRKILNKLTAISKSNSLKLGKSA